MKTEELATFIKLKYGASLKDTYRLINEVPIEVVDKTLKQMKLNPESIEWGSSDPDRAKRFTLTANVFDYKTLQAMETRLLHNLVEYHLKN